ncbi:MAG: acetyl-CoA C-acyltransferase [Deltaproteobacteria bacterium]|nr:acetyl-CoA C-acyltransferase [Deltaproteobacteria bacterium]
MAAKKPAAPRVAVIDGARTPFLRGGTDFNDLMAYELGRIAVAGLMHKTGVDPALIESVYFGCVMADPSTSNVAREITLAAGLPKSVAAYTISEACISANQAVTNAADQIRLGHADLVVAGGTDITSDVPIRFSKRMRQKFIRANRAKGWKDYYAIFKDVRPADLAPDAPGIEDFFTRMSMGESCDRMCKRLGVTREEQDEYAARSHQLAAKATADGVLADEIVPVAPPPKFKAVTTDNGIRGDSTKEKLAKLPPAFDRKYGTVTAGNASFLTDGAAAVLLASEKAVRELGLKPKAYIRSYAFRGTDPQEEMLLGQTYATPIALARAGLKFQDMGVLEIHEAFAGQMIATIKLLGSKEFAKEHFGMSDKIGDVDYDKLNLHGGSLSLGHPFGATGARLVTTCANRLQREDKNTA